MILENDRIFYLYTQRKIYFWSPTCRSHIVISFIHMFIVTGRESNDIFFLNFKLIVTKLLFINY